MAEYMISTDTSCDFPYEYVQQHQLPLVTLFYSIDDVMGPDGSPTLENLKSFYNKMRQGAPTKTQQASIEDTEKLFRTILSKGVDLLHIAFSSGLSGTANAARLAAETLKEEFPDRKIMVVDSLCASMGQGLLVDSAIRMKEAGKSIEEVAQWLEENIPHLCHLFTVEDLKYLQRGGRISKTTALVGTMIGIKPVLHVDDAGHLIPMEKVRGRKASLDALVAHMEKDAVDPASQTVFISHGDCRADAEYVADLVREKFGTQDIRIHSIGPVIGSHSGPGTVALFYLGRTRG
ncbi:MAG: DegV family protein [Negativibacillus sp.]